MVGEDLLGAVNATAEHVLQLVVDVEAAPALVDLG
jgi:hypothetical protein